MTAPVATPRRGHPSDGPGRRIAACLLPVGIAIALIPLRNHVSAANLALVVVIAVLAAAVLGGRAAGFVAGLLAAAAFDFFLTAPYGSFRIHDPDDVVTAVLLALVGVAGGHLVERARRSEADAIARRTELARLHRHAEIAAGGETEARLIAQTGAELGDLLRPREVRFHHGPAPDDVAILTHWGAKVPAGQGRHGATVIAVPVRAHGRDIGHFRLAFDRPTAAMHETADTRHAALATADQLGMALLRFHRPA